MAGFTIAGIGVPYYVGSILMGVTNPEKAAKLEGMLKARSSLDSQVCV